MPLSPTTAALLPSGLTEAESFTGGTTMIYTLQISDHPDAGARIPTQDAADSWMTIYDGPIATPAEARQAVDELAQWHRHARAFRGRTLGRQWYAVLRMHGVAASDQ